MAYRSIVVGTDGSATAEHAVREAAELAKSFGSRLTIVTAFMPRSEEEVARDQDKVPDDLRWMLTDAAQAEDRAGAGRAVAAHLGLEDVDVRVGRGDPAEVLIEGDDVGRPLRAWQRAEQGEPPRALRPRHHPHRSVTRRGISHWTRRWGNIEG